MKLEHIWPPNPLKSADFSDEIKTIVTPKALKKCWFADEIKTNLTPKTAWKVLICWWNWNKFDPQKAFKSNDFFGKRDLNLKPKSPL